MSRVVGAFTILTLLLLMGVAVSRLMYPYDCGFCEGTLWAPAQEMALGLNPYDVALSLKPPYTMCPYGPLYYGVLAVGIRAFGLQFWFGRLVSWGAWTGCVILVFHILRALGQARLQALAGSAAFVAMMPVQCFIAVQRPDDLALVLALAGLLVWVRRQTTAGMAVAGLLFAGAALARVSTIGACLAVGIVLLGRREYRQAAVLGAAFVLPFVAVTLALNVASDGGHVWEAYRLLTHVPLQLPMLAWTFHYFWKSAALPLLFVGYRTSPGVRAARPPMKCAPHGRASRPHPGGRMVGMYVVISLVIAVVTSARMGAAVNYYLDPSAAVALAFGMVLPERWEKSTALVLLGVSAYSVFTALSIARYESDRWKALPYYQAIVHILEQPTYASAPVVSFNPELAVAAQRTCYFNDITQYDGRAPQQQACYQRLVQDRALSAMVLLDAGAPPGYRSVPVPVPIPRAYYPLYLYEPVQEKSPIGRSGYTNDTELMERPTCVAFPRKLARR